MSDALEILNEVQTSADLRGLHPLKLDRWHRALLGIPDPIYMQYGCAGLLEQVQKASTALRAMVDLLGLSGLPVAPQELAQRTVQTFRWYLPSEHFDDLIEFQASWDKEGSTWRLTSPVILDTVKSVPDLEVAFEKSQAWIAELKPEIDEDTDDEG